eukprot:UN01949
MVPSKGEMSVLKQLKFENQIVRFENINFEKKRKIWSFFGYQRTFRPRVTYQWQFYFKKFSLKFSQFQTIRCESEIYSSST